MPIKTLVAGITGGDKDAATLRTAFTLARRFKAHVEVFFGYPQDADLVPIAGEAIATGVMEQVLKQAHEEVSAKQAKAESTFESIREEMGVMRHDTPPGPGAPSASFHAESGRLEIILPRLGLLADCVIVNHHEDQAYGEHGVLIFEAALMHSGRPIILAPESVPSAIGGTIAIAWSPTPQAARAVAGAMPLLREAAQVTVLTADTSKTASKSGSRLVDYLAWHTIDATAQALEADSRGVGAALLGQAEDLGADLLVMGGYGHSRLRQMILGGVTSHILSNAKIPVLMAH